MNAGSATIRPATRARLCRPAAYWALIKDLQTGLLLLTAATAYSTGCCANLNAAGMGALLGSLFLAVSGSTILNMVLDRDIDARMSRTAARPLPSGRITTGEAAFLGAAMSLSGVGWALALDPLYGAVVLAGLLLDVVVYTAWLKRRTPLAVVIGGLAGAMPALAGRALAVGQIDAAGLLLAGVILCWIPTHIMTLQIRCRDDYAAAGVPTFPAAFGISVTRGVILASTVLTWLLMLAAGLALGLPAYHMRALAVLGAVLAGLAGAGAWRGKARLNFALYKGASLYMLASELLLLSGAF
ncbi:MAG: protoheme IX farnesyltransferase [Anaerolineae bacterium]|nr:protoheme IX farnesyltransferase [Anaerolineae bacterium]